MYLHNNKAADVPESGAESAQKRLFCSGLLAATSSVYSQSPALQLPVTHVLHHHPLPTLLLTNGIQSTTPTTAPAPLLLM